MAQSLLLDSLDIRGFRAFRHLQIERLGRVNLIVGKNNVGKTCLLEALSLYASRGSLLLIRDLLNGRGETSRFSVRHPKEAGDHSIKYLFHGRQDLWEQRTTIQIGPIDPPDDALTIDVAWFTGWIDENGQRRLQLQQLKDDDRVDTLVPGLEVKVGDKLHMRYPLDRAISNVRAVVSKSQFEEISQIFVPANGLNKEQSGRLWDSVALTDLEHDVLASLRIIAPKVERVNLLGSQEQNGERVPMVKLAGFQDPLPLGNLGEGMNRLFGIALALANSKNGMLLLDEVDSGLHFSVQPELWNLILQMAYRLDVQVFATTHSWDCIEAFQQATLADGRGQGLLISLREKQDEPGQVVAVLFDEQELIVVTREQIEVR